MPVNLPSRHQLDRAAAIGGLTLVAAALLVGVLARPMPAAAASGVLNAVVGPGFTINLTKSGAALRSVPAGTYTIKVTDRSADHNFRLVGPGVNKATTVRYRGTQTWRVTLRPGTYRFVCDPHADGMKGTVKVTKAAAARSARELPFTGASFARTIGLGMLGVVLLGGGAALVAASRHGHRRRRVG